jgi:hypothetical protein
MKIDKIRTSYLWFLAENKKIKKGDIFISSKGDEFIFTGKSFKLHFTEEDVRYVFVGMNIDESWTFSHNDVFEVDSWAKERK